MQRYQPQHQMPKAALQLRNGNYYYIKNTGNNKYLSINKSLDSDRSYLYLSQLNPINAAHQIWMIDEFDLDRYQIVHAMSTFVLEEDDKKIKIRPNKQKNAQMFNIERVNSEYQPNVFYILESKGTKKYVFFENQQMQCYQKPLYRHQSNKWTFELIKQHNFLKTTCIIEFTHSNHVIQVPEASEKQNEKIVQNSLNKMFNQRWQIEREDEYYIIRNLKSSFVLGIKQQKKKQGTNVVQQKYKQDLMGQRWMLQNHGRKIYLLRSALDHEFVMSVQNHCLKEGSTIVITKNQALAFWRIVGHIQH